MKLYLRQMIATVLSEHIIITEKCITIAHPRGTLYLLAIANREIA